MHHKKTDILTPKMKLPHMGHQASATALIKACDNAGGLAQVGTSHYWLVDGSKYEIKERVDE